MIGLSNIDMITNKVEITKLLSYKDDFLNSLNKEEIKLRIGNSSLKNYINESINSASNSDNPNIISICEKVNDKIKKVKLNEIVNIWPQNIKIIISKTPYEFDALGYCRSNNIIILNKIDKKLYYMNYVISYKEIQIKNNKLNY